jgi:outer membrane protein, heavy metal efflux system
MKKIFVLFLAGVLLIEGGILCYAETLSLEPLINEAKEMNPEILAAKKNWESSLARVPQAKAFEDPKIGVKFEKMKGGPLKFDKTMPEDRMLSFAQFIPFFGKLPLKGKIAVVESQMAAAEYKDKELEVVNGVKSAYYALFMNHKETELNERSLEFLGSISKIAEARYIVGKLQQEDVFKINLEIASLSNKVANLRQERSAKETRLNVLLSRDPEGRFGAPELSETASFDNDIGRLYKLTLQNKPELLVFSYAIDKNKYAKSLAQKSYFPDLFGELIMRGITSGSIGPWDLMLAFTVPIWFWTKQRYQVKEAIADLEQAQAAYTAMKNRAFAETKDMATKTEIARGRIELYKKSLIPLLEASINSSVAAFSSGKGELMTLLDSERMLINTEMDYYRVLAEYNTNLADLERTVGSELTETLK